MARSPRKSANKPAKPAHRGHARAKTNIWYPVFLAEVAASMNVRRACEKAEVDSTTVYDRRESDKAFAAAWDEALTRACDKAEAELYRRAVEGVEKPVTVAGNREVITEYSNDLLMFMLRAHRPKLYREKQEITGKDGGPVTIRVVYDEPKEEPNAQSR